MVQFPNKKLQVEKRLARHQLPINNLYFSLEIGQRVIYEADSTALFIKRDLRLNCRIVCQLLQQVKVAFDTDQILGITRFLHF